MQLIGDFLIVLMIGAAQVVVIWLASLVRRYVLRTVSLAGALAISHAAIVLGCMALYPTDIFCPPGPYDDVYYSYMFVPGLHIAWLGENVAFAFWPKLQTMMSFHAASLLCIVVIPGFVCLVLGTLQWYLIGLLWRWKHPNALQPTATRFTVRGG